MEHSAAVERSLRSFHDVDNIVGAMKAYAGVAFRKAEEVAANLRECEEGIRAALEDLVLSHPGLVPAVAPEGRRLVVACGSSLGLCGTFNERVLEALAALLGEGDALIAVGRKLHQLAELQKVPCAGHLEAPASVDGVTRALQECVTLVDALYAGTGYYTLTLVFTTVSGNRGTVTAEQVLPFNRAAAPGEDEGAAPLLYEEAEAVFAGILREYLSLALYRAFVESLRSENWYRLRTMEGASETLKRRMGELRAQYNYLRQEEITEEMLEILGGGMFYRRSPGGKQGER